MMELQPSDLLATKDDGDLLHSGQRYLGNQTDRFIAAWKDGLEIVVCDDPDIITLDIDSPHESGYVLNYRDFHEKTGVGVENYMSTRSRKGNIHVYIALGGEESLAKTICPKPLVLNFIAAAALGSDPIREKLNAERCISGVEPCSVMFEYPDVAEAVVRVFPGLRLLQQEEVTAATE